jgi:capsular polysaccharide transport system permease protein
MSVPQLPQRMATAGRPRNAWEVQRAVVFALLQREMKARVGGQWIGAVWTLFEPLSHVLVLLTIYTVFLNRQGPLLSIEYAVFLVTGMLPYFLFQNLALRLMDGIESNRGLFSYRQVKPLDTLVSRAIVEALMNLFVYAFTLALLGWMGFHVWPTAPLELLGVQGLMFCLGAGCGILLAVLSDRRPKVKTFVRMLLIPLYLASGVLFPVDLAPNDALQWLLLNPLLHLIEMSRHAFIPEYVPLPQVTWRYPAIFTLSVTALALLLYRADRRRLTTS